MHIRRGTKQRTCKLARREEQNCELKIFVFLEQLLEVSGPATSVLWFCFVP